MPIPHLRKQGSATQLVVDGQPLLVPGGERRPVRRRIIFRRLAHRRPTGEVV